MSNILVTAFEPYLEWESNATELVLNALQQQSEWDLPPFDSLILPVEYQQCQAMIVEQYKKPWDFVLHLGQAPGSTKIALERFALNFKSVEVSQPAKLDENGPAAFCSELPLDDWASVINQQNIPTTVSCHAGTYLCNAVYYWSSLAGQMQNPQNCLFVHTPLTEQQAESCEKPGLPVSDMAKAVGILLKEIAKLGKDKPEIS